MIFRLFVFIIFLLYRGESFLAPSRCFLRLSTYLFLSSNDPYERSWRISNDFQTFLNQCSIQSFTFLLKSLRDPRTVRWIENFTQPAIERAPQSQVEWQHLQSSGDRLLSYHGLGVINTTIFPTWDSYFNKLLEQPIETQTIYSDSPHIPDYDHEIKPASLCSRIISVREQIAGEFVRDLGVIASLGGYTIESYWESLQKLRDEENASGGVSFQRPNIMFLEYQDDGYEVQRAQSPLRKGNFDLLCLLTLQEAIHRVLNDPERRHGPEKHANDFLDQFYGTRFLTHFSGAQRYGRADDFLEELLSSSPSVRSGEDGTVIIDPLRLVELILEAREVVALEWQEQARQVPEMHSSIKRAQLNLLMGIHPSGQQQESVTSESEGSVFE